MTRPKHYNPQVWQYENDVLSGKVIAGRLLKLAIERQRRDLEFGHQRGLWFDYVAGQRIIDFCGLLFLEPGKPLVLQVWQKFELYTQYGWKRSNGFRRFRQKYKCVARKNGKTALEAAIALFHLCIDGPYNAEAYVIATKEAQAKIAFNDGKNILSCTEDLQDELDSTAESIFTRNAKGSFKFLTSNPKTLDGLRPSHALADEYHEWESDDPLAKIKTGMINQDEPMLDITSTRGSHKDWPCFEAERVLYIPILEGTVEDDSVLVLIHALDDESEWDKPECWPKPNPGLGTLMPADAVLNAYNESLVKGEEAVVAFKTLNLNWWCDAPQTFIPDQIYVGSGAVKPDSVTPLNHRLSFEQAILGKPCWAGLDMSQTNDFTALALYFPPDEWQHYETEARNEKREGQSDPMYLRTPLRVPGRGHLLWRFWIPKFKYEQRIQNGLHSLRDWEKAGYIRFLEGNVIDPLAIEAEIQTLHGQFPIRQLLYDRYNATSTAIALDRFGIPCMELPQTMPFMAEPTKAFRDLILQQRLDHGGNPIARWMMRNAVPIADTNQNIKITKDPRRAADKVDGVVAAIMALASWMKEEAVTESAYANRGIEYF